MRRIATLLVIGFSSVACAGGEPVEEVGAGPDSTQLAREAFDPIMFDTVSWETPAEAVERGQVVYRFSCLKCHGDRGLGNAAFVRAGDTLRPPSFREPTWAYAGDKAGIREQVFVGTAENMPHWGLVGLGARDVDAVATYILEGMPER
jgi:mono/diheme cytochrome c family protein